MQFTIQEISIPKWQNYTYIEPNYNKSEYLFGRIIFSSYLCAMNTILCINGSDSMGHSGLQADIRTVKDLGGYAVTAVTAVTVQNHTNIIGIHELPSDLIVGQIRAIYEEEHPKAIKVGLVNNVETIKAIRNEIIGCQRIVASPVILSSQGGCLMSNEAIFTFCRTLLPICTILMLKCTDAEIILGHSITTDNEMKQAAHQLREMGAQWVLLRGGTYMEGRINALLQGPDVEAFFSSVNIEGWQRHGVGGTLSTAIATHLALGEEVPLAVNHAHDYLHSQVVYASQKSAIRPTLQPQNLYNAFLSLLAEHHRVDHNVSFYAAQLAISTRYLSQITNFVSGQTPKQIIDNYLLKEAEQMLSSTTLTIQEISIALGFSSQVTFAKFFKSKRAIAPTTYRANLALRLQ